MQKLIPTIYFYLLSAVGVVLFIIGVFNSFHYVTGITAYDKYPLKYGAETRCQYIPVPVATDGTMKPVTDQTQKDCQDSLETERKNTKIDDFEKSVSYTVIGLLVFASHFYFARRRSS